MNKTPQSERLHIGLFGRRNAGKSSLINAITNQEVSLVSDTPGTTTDPVFKSMEVLPIGPVVFIDTAGLDDEGELGTLRVKRSRSALQSCDIAIVVVSAEHFGSDLSFEKEILSQVESLGIPSILVWNKADEFEVSGEHDGLVISAKKGTGIDELKKRLISEANASWHEMSLLEGLVESGETAVLVCPIDDAAPKGRLILPQVQTIRDLLDHDALAVVVKERELAHALRNFKEPPKIVITDSQAFQKVAADTPPEIWMTSFSVLFARYKGDLEAYTRGVKAIGELQDGDKILIAESCTHHVQSDDIGTVKIPRWIRSLTGKELNFEKSAGKNFPDDLKDYKLVIQCGGCMLNRRAIQRRIRFCESEGVPITNYGMAIAYSFGILERALKPFGLMTEILDGDIY